MLDNAKAFFFGKDETTKIQRPQESTNQKGPQVSAQIEEEKDQNQFQGKFAKRLDSLSKYPAVVKIAKYHDKASSFGAEDKDRSKNKKILYCNCCQLPIHKKRYGLHFQTTPDYFWLQSNDFKFFSKSTEEKQTEQEQRQKQLNNQNPRVSQKSQNKIEGEKKDKAKIRTFILDQGTSMYFTFIKMVVIYLILKFLIFDVYNLITNISTSATTAIPAQFESDLTFVKLSSFYKVIDSTASLQVSDVLSLVWILLSIAYFNVYRKMLYKMDQNTIDLEPDQFTILVENIPLILPETSEQVHADTFKDTDTRFQYKEIIEDYFSRKIVQNFYSSKFHQSDKEEIRKFILDDFGRTKELEAKLNLRQKNTRIVTSVNPCYDLEDIENIRKLRDDLMEKYEAKTEDERNSDKKTLDYIKFLNEREVRYGASIFTNDNMDWHLSHFTGKAFVTFEYSHFRYFILNDFYEEVGKPVYEGFDMEEIENVDDFLRNQIGKGRQIPKYQRKTQYTMFENELFIDGAAKPLEINWMNMKVTTSERRKRIFISYGFLVLMLGTIFAVLLGINKIKEMIQSQDASKQTNVLGVVLSLMTTGLVFGVNFLLGKIVIYLTNDEKHQDQEEYNVSLVIKTVLTQFINTAVLFLIIAIFLQNDTDIVTQTGIINSITATIVQYGFIAILTNFFNGNFVKYAFTKIATVKPTADKFQKTLNAEFERQRFDFPGRFAYYILQFLTVSFYSSLSPITVVALIIIFILQYWVDKYMLFKYSSFQIGLNFRINRLILRIFQCSLVIFSVGNLVTAWALLERPVSPILIAGVIISCVYIGLIVALPDSLELKIFGSKNKVITKMTYNSCEEDKIFTTSYWKENPATKYVPETRAEQYNDSESQYYDNNGESDNESVAPDNESINDAYEEEEVDVKTRQYMAYNIDQWVGSEEEEGTYADRKCPFNHQLKKYTLEEDDYFASCDICKNDIDKKGQTSSNCTKCNFDLCDTCVKKPQEEINKEKQLKTDIICNKGHKCQKVLQENYKSNVNPSCSICCKYIFQDDEQFFECKSCSYFKLCYYCSQHYEKQDYKEILDDRKTVKAPEVHKEHFLDVHSVSDNIVERKPFCNVCGEGIHDMEKTNEKYKDNDVLYGACLICDFDACENCVLKDAKVDLNKIMYGDEVHEFN